MTTNKIFTAQKRTKSKLSMLSLNIVAIKLNYSQAVALVEGGGVGRVGAKFFSREYHTRGGHTAL
jgi:hypothetical protein